jgi:hypothetical protein
MFSCLSCKGRRMRKAKQWLAQVSMAGILAASVVVVTPGSASAATKWCDNWRGGDCNFVLFSNRSGYIYTWCVTAFDEYDETLDGDCDNVGINQKSTFWVPRNATTLSLEKYEAFHCGFGCERDSVTVGNGKDWCYRASFSGTVHRAKEQLCTPD